MKNVKLITRTEDVLKGLMRFEEYVKKLLKDYKYVWNVELLNEVEIPLPDFSFHSFLKFILVSNEIKEANEINTFLDFEKKKKKIYINSFNFKFLNLIEGLPVFELI